MRMSTLVTLLVVGGSGVAAFILSYGYLGQTPDPNKGKVAVLYAVSALKRGEAMELGKNVDFRMVAETDIPEDAYRRDEKLMQEMQSKKFIAFQPIPRNENLRRGVAGNNPAGVLENELKADPNTRAYSVPTTTTGAVAGFIKPGATVDLWWSGNVGRRLKEVSKILLSDVKVIAVDLENQSGPQAQGKEVRMITFALTSEQIAKIVFAQAHGQISAALRGSTSVTGKDVEVTWDTLFKNGDGKNSASDEEAMSKTDSKELEGDALSLLNTLEAALNTQPTGPAKPLLVNTNTKPTRREPIATWMMFEVRNVEGKVISKVPVRSNSAVAKNNRHLLREPEADELEAIQRYEMAHSGPTR